MMPPIVVEVPLENRGEVGARGQRHGGPESASAFVEQAVDPALPRAHGVLGQRRRHDQAGWKTRRHTRSARARSRRRGCRA